MSFNTTHEFLSPVGGVPFPEDFGPSILFAILYAHLLPIALWRIISPGSRNYVLIGTVMFTIEHVVSWGLRAHAAHHVGSRESASLQAYLQATLGAGYISITQDLITLLRAFLVSTTLGSEMQGRIKLDRGPQGNDKLTSHAESRNKFTVTDPGELEDHPRTRFWVRQVCGYGALLALAAIIMSAIAGVDYKNAAKSGAHAALVRQLWYASSAIALFLLLGLVLGATWACFRLPRVPKRPVMWLIVVASLLSVVGIYRLVVLQYSTTSLTSRAPGSQNSTVAKALFYIFHVVPEFLAVTILVCLNIRRTFSTGLWGDIRGIDPKPKA